MQPRSTYSDDEAAALYDLLNPWSGSDDFYLALVLEAPSVLDVGCGTGALLRRAREAGHQGRLCGVDPDESRLSVARRRADVEWVAAKAASMQFAREFELALMTGHAFQELVTDADIRDSLEAIRRALVDGGRFVFDTRNPLARAWESWSPENGMDVVDASGREIRIWHDVEAVADGVVTLTETTGDRDGDAVTRRSGKTALRRRRGARSIPRRGRPVHRSAVRRLAGRDARGRESRDRHRRSNGASLDRRLARQTRASADAAASASWGTPCSKRAARSSSAPSSPRRKRP